MTLSAASRRSLLETIDTQRLGCQMAGSPLSADVLDVVAADLTRGGPFERLLVPLAGARFGDAVLLRLLAALHLVVLEGQAPALAAHYPSVGGQPGVGLSVAIMATAEEHHRAIAALLAEGVQTNEVGRSASLLGGYLEVAKSGLPLRVLEVGSSAGLNLLFDRFRYVQGDQTWGPAGSPLVFDQPWRVRAPDLRVDVRVAERRGSDVAPIDPVSEAGRRRLRSFVWADQLDRLARLDAALFVAADDPPVVDAAEAGPWLESQLADATPGVCTVVTHSIVAQYLTAEGRTRATAAIEAAGSRATPEAPLAWLRMEPGGDQADIRLTRWPGGRTDVVATSAYHGPPVVWRGVPSA